MSKLEMPAVPVTCHKCGWAYSSRNESCPMCGAPTLLSERELISHLETFVDLQGIYISKKEAKNFIKQYKKNYKKLPALGDLWEAAKQLAKLEDMEKDEIKALEKKKKAKEQEALKKKMRELEEKKKNEKEEARKKKKKEKQPKLVPKKISTQATTKPTPIAGGATTPSPLQPKTILICPECGTKNPSGSKFCLECGHQF